MTPNRSLVLCLLLGVSTASAAEIVVDCARTNGTIRALHGGNGGPIAHGGTLDFSAQFRELRPPLVRLHDCEWPHPTVVDIHTLFPDPAADPAVAESYDFRRTDDYLRAIVEKGAGIVYRLGESIEHTPTKYFVHPPADPERWAAICVGIVRHYNEGWAEGHAYGIRYWEIWNEPENKPAMWTGSDEQYFQLYAATARALKARWPDLKVGGPSLGYTGTVRGEAFEPGEYLVKFLAFCREQRLPLDFFSWHLYTDDPRECVVRARGIRDVLDQSGFVDTEMHFNEWNYLPDGSWEPLMPPGQGAERARFFERMHGAEGAAFTAAVLANLQDTRVEVANYYSFAHHGFGCFDEAGVALKPYYALLAFRRLVETPLRLEATCDAGGGLAVLAGTHAGSTEVRVLVARTDGQDTPLRLRVENLPWAAGTRYEWAVVDAGRNLEVTRSGAWTGVLEIGEALVAPAVGLLILRPDAKKD